jgi:hypothetical protein
MPPMQKEYAALVGHETWVLVDAPAGANIVDCKWVYAVKYDNRRRGYQMEGASGGEGVPTN